MPRYKINIKYDGSNFFGWQSQSDKPTIQGTLEEALKPLNNGERIIVTGAGRTDAGVHAHGQVAHFDLTTKLTDAELLKALNARLPQSISISEIRITADDFHARFSAKRRYYNYQCYTGENLLFNNQAWLVKSLDLEALNQYAKLLLGKHDFLSFSKLNKKLDNTICEIYQSEWIQNQEMITFKICGNRFLHHMVRYLVGTMIAGVFGKISIKQFLNLLNSPQKDAKVFMAPPQGLILTGIDYEN